MRQETSTDLCHVFMKKPGHDNFWQCFAKGSLSGLFLRRKQRNKFELQEGFVFTLRRPICLNSCRRAKIRSVEHFRYRKLLGWRGRNLQSPDQLD